MSHELRTPLNTLLILAKLLARQPGGQPHRQAGRVRAARSTPRVRTCSRSSTTSSTCRRSSRARWSIDARRGRRSRELHDYVERNVPPGGGATSSSSSTSSSAPDLPRAMSHRPDAAAAGAEEPARRNAFKFTEQRQGRRCTIERGDRRLDAGAHESLDRAEAVIAFCVTRHRHRHPGRQAAASSSRRSSRPTAPPPASTAAPASASRSAARSRACSAARSASRASRARAPRSRSILPQTLHRAGVAAPRRGARRRRRRARSARDDAAAPRADAVERSDAERAPSEALLMLPNELGDDRDDDPAGRPRRC